MNLNKIRVSFQGIPSYMWLDDNGLTYREESIMGLVMERTTPEEALKTDQLAGGLDLINAYALPVDPPIESPGDLTELTVELEGIEPHYLQALNSARQEVLSTEPLRVRLRPIPVPADSTNLETYLAATPTIQSTHPKIQAICALYNEENYSNEEKTRLLRHWVYKYLKKRPVVSLATASEIVERGVGDCSEHTILFTALSRGLGIPTKIHVGLVYLEGRFLYHAWPVVYLNQQWVAVDPTLDQPVADATHIALLESDFTNLYQLIPILGRISIRIINQQYGKPTS
jgi:transglutaminase-like putative cysteine protease